MKTVICVLLLYSTVSVFSQTVSYTYDNAGNRITRQASSFRSSKVQETATALPKVITEKDFSIYPNPTQGHFTVDISNISHDNLQGEAYLFDTNGRLIEKKSIHSHSTHKKLNFNLSHKSAGIYILNIRLEGNTFTWKIIKK